MPRRIRLELEDTALPSDDARRPVDPCRVRLLGHFGVACCGTEVVGFERRRVQELFAYLIINHGRSVPREMVVEELWGGRGTDPRKHLRHALWQLQRALEQANVGRVLDVTSEQVAFREDAGVDADVLALEAAHQRVVAARDPILSERTTNTVRAAVAAYRGDLLESSYEDWISTERLRYRSIFLALLDALLVRAERCGDFADGIAYAEQLLHHDRASELTHRRLMAMRARCGDRTGALRQFDACATALRDELDVDPGAATVALAAAIRAGAPIEDGATFDAGTGTVAFSLHSLLELQRTLAAATSLVDDAVTQLRALDGHATRDAGETS